MKQKPKADKMSVPRWRMILSNGLQVLCVCIIGLGIVQLPFMLVIWAPKISSMRPVIEITVPLGMILVILGLMSAGIARLISRETLWLKPYIITLLIVFLAQAVITALHTDARFI